MSADPLIRVHQRIDETLNAMSELRTEVRIAVHAQKSASESVEKLSSAVSAMIHATPCRDLVEMQKTIDKHLHEHVEERRQTVALQRENKSILKNAGVSIAVKFFLYLAGIVTVAVLAYIQGVGK